MWNYSDSDALGVGSLDSARVLQMGCWPSLLPFPKAGLESFWPRGGGEVAAIRALPS